METRWLKKVKVLGPTFVGVTVKEEPQDAVDESDEHRPRSEVATVPKKLRASRRKLSKTISSNTNTSESFKNQLEPRVSKRNRGTQVTPEDFAIAMFKESDRVEMLDKGTPIEVPSGEHITPQCRICLRRVARKNLEIIMTQHKKKARVAFQIRVISHDAYPFICINCQSLLDMFFDFKEAMIKAKNLLKCKRAHIENNGWDDKENVELFNKCKEVIKHHRQQIDSLYEERSNIYETEVEEEYADDNDSDADNGDVDESVNEPVIKPECVVNEGSSVSIDETVPDEVVETDLPMDEHSEQESDESEPDDPMDEDYKVEDDELEDDNFHPKKVKMKKEKPVKQFKQPQTVNRQLCDFCGESFRPESVESHRNKHLGIKPYKCLVEKCEAACSSRVNLAKHMKKFHKPGGVGAHHCNICGKVIHGSIGDLKYHQKRHNLVNKSFVCPVCGKGFTMKRYLEQHSIIHTGEFPHKCQYCGKKFNNKWSMKTHEKNIHEKKNQLANKTEQQEASNLESSTYEFNPIPIPVTYPHVDALIVEENSSGQRPTEYRNSS